MGLHLGLWEPSVHRPLRIVSGNPRQKMANISWPNQFVYLFVQCLFCAWMFFAGFCSQSSNLHTSYPLPAVHPQASTIDFFLVKNLLVLSLQASDQMTKTLGTSNTHTPIHPSNQPTIPPSNQPTIQPLPIQLYFHSTIQPTIHPTN